MMVAIRCAIVMMVQLVNSVRIVSCIVRINGMRDVTTAAVVFELKEHTRMRGLHATLVKEIQRWHVKHGYLAWMSWSVIRSTDDVASSSNRIWAGGPHMRHSVWCKHSFQISRHVQRLLLKKSGLYVFIFVKKNRFDKKKWVLCFCLHASAFFADLCISQQRSR